MLQLGLFQLCNTLDFKMKFTALCLAALAFCTAAQADMTAVAEYDYNRTARAGESHYVATGLVYTPKESMYFVDGYAQAVTSYVGPRDNMVGYEFGVGRRFILSHSLTGSARLGVGTMGGINYGSTRANYALGSVELNYQLAEGVALYAGASHSNGLNATAIPASNRVQAGVDYMVTDGFWARFGLSSTRQTNQWVNGFVVVVSKGF